MENLILLPYEEYIKLRASVRESGVKMIVVHESKLSDRQAAGWHPIAYCQMDYSGGGTVATYCMIKN